MSRIGDAVQGAAGGADVLQTAIDGASPDRIFVIDSSGSILHANQAAAASVQLPAAALLQSCLFEILPADESGGLRKIYESALTSGTAGTYQAQRDGRYFETTVQPFPGQDDGIMSLCIRDITPRKLSEIELELAREEMEIRVTERTAELMAEIAERKIVESSLKQSEERFRDIALSAADRFWETDEEFRYVFVSKPDAGYWLEPEEMLGRRPWEIRNVIEENDNWDELEKMFEAGEPVRDFRFNRKHPDFAAFGGIKYFRMCAVPFLNAQGEFQGYRGTTTNESEEVIAKLAADDLQFQFTEGMENLTEGFVLWSDRDELIYCNSHYMNNTPEHLRGTLVPGLKFESYLRTRMEAGLIPEADGREEEWLAGHLAARVPGTLDVFRQNRWIQIRRQRLANGTMVEFHTDITDQKMREEDLRMAQEEADIANRAKSEFLANMSHELRSPLTAILGYSEVMQEETFGPLNNPKYEEYIDGIRNSGLHLHQLINDILDVSAIEAGKLTLQEEVISIPAVLESVLHMMAIRIDEANLTLSSDIPENLPRVVADERRLKQIMINILSNAVKFTRAEGAIEVSAKIDRRRRLAISVYDTGIGMDESGVSIARRKFGQVDGSMTRDVEGSGLGLPLTEGLISAHGGSMDIDSTLGQGTRVTITLPARRLLDEASE